MQAGRLNTRVTFRRRPYISETERGDFEDYLTVWAAYAAATGRAQMKAGQEVDLRTGTLTIRDSVTARQICASERVRIRDVDHAITTVGLPDPRSGLIELSTTSDIADS